MLADEDQKTRTFLKAEGGICNIGPPREGIQDHDIFLSVAVPYMY